MSDGSIDLLIQGRAAAQAGLHDEARFYLEWALRRDLDYRDQEDAWWWLSQVTDEPAARRDCLEQVLALNPGHGGARRALAILDGRLDPAALRDPAAPVAPIAPEAAVPAGQVRHYHCPQCGGKLAFEPRQGRLACAHCGYQAAAPTAPEAPRAAPPTMQHVFCPQCGSKIALPPGSDALHCQFCGHRRAVPGLAPPPPVSPPAPADQVTEQDFVVALNLPRGHRWVLPTARVLTCQACGAVVTGAPAQVSLRCPFCGSAYVVVGEAHPDLIAPEGVLPFRLTAPAALTAARAWLAAARFRPGDLDARATLLPPRPVYVPVWTFDIAGEIRWAGHLIEYDPINRRPTRHSTSGSEPILFDDLLVPASPALADPTLAALRFDTRALAPYSPDLLADWPAEIYRVAVADASLQAREQAVRATRAHLDTDVAPQVEEFIVTGSYVSVLSYKLILLPVWLTAYGYAGRHYPVVIDGHAGHVDGAVPRNLMQRALDRFFDGE